MANCRICTGRKLFRTKLIDALTALGCAHAHCGVNLSSLVNYQAWRETNRSDDTPSDALGTASPGTAGAAQNACQCPKCNNVISKYHLDIESDARLDFCSLRGKLVRPGRLGATPRAGTKYRINSNFHPPVPTRIDNGQNIRHSNQALATTVRGRLPKHYRPLQCKQAQPQNSLMISHINDAVRNGV